ncbi:hypothetical protein Unana1_08262 [Umbelopsis nana]
MEGDMESTPVLYHPPSSVPSTDPPAYLGASQAMPGIYEYSVRRSPRFTTFYIPTIGRQLDSGFQRNYPEQFEQHQISHERWYCFLQELSNQAQITSVCKVSTATLLFGMAGFFASRSARRSVLAMKSVELRDLVNQWSDTYFNSKGVHITLLKGDLNIIEGRTADKGSRRRRLSQAELRYYLQVEAL